MKKHGENGMACAKYLETNNRIAKVVSPGLPSHPQHELFRKVARGMSGMVCFYIKVRKFIKHANNFVI
jgi:cystathionine gamma-lyase